MEASTLRPAATLPRPRITVGAPLLRLRSDEQLVALFRAGHEEAFGAIHDRYHRRLFAYARQMLPGRQDAEDVLQDVFVRAYAGLRASNRDLALRPWLFRVAHNRCVDQLRKPSAPPFEVLQLVRSPAHDPLAEVDMRESLRRLVEDIRRLPDQQRSALLMRELAGMSYADLSSSLGVSVGAVKSLLVRARLALAQASEARETACVVIREHLIEAHDRGVRPNANARRHLRDCACCKGFRRELRGVSRQLAAVAPAVGPLGFVAKVLGFSGGGGAGGSAALLGGGGTTASVGGLALSTGHVATLIVAAVATAGGGVELQRTILPTPHHAARVHRAFALPNGYPGTSGPISTASNAQALASKAQPVVASAPGGSVAIPNVPAAKPAKRHGAAPPRATGGVVLAPTSGLSSTTSTTTSTGGTGTATESCGTSPGGATSGTTSSTTTPAAGGSATSSSTPASSSPTPTCDTTEAGSTTASPSSTDGSTSTSAAGTGDTGSTSSGSATGTAASSSSGDGSSGSSSDTTGA